MLRMPITRFWFYLKQIPRLRAEEDLRFLRLLVSAQSGESFNKAAEDLNRDLGEIYVYQPVQRTIVVNGNEQDPEFDRAGLQALKTKYQGKKGDKSKVTGQ